MYDLLFSDIQYQRQHSALQTTRKQKKQTNKISGVLHTSSLGDPGGVVGLAAVLSPIVAVTLSGDLGGDFSFDGDFTGVLSLSFPTLLSSLKGNGSSLLSLDSEDLSGPLSSVLLSLGAESEGPLSALLSFQIRRVSIA